MSYVCYVILLERLCALLLIVDIVEEAIYIRCFFSIRVGNTIRAGTHRHIYTYIKKLIIIISGNI